MQTAPANKSAFGGILYNVQLSPNNALQRTFDPLLAFAFAKAGIASNAAERWRYVSGWQ